MNGEVETLGNWQPTLCASTCKTRRAESIVSLVSCTAGKSSVGEDFLERLEYMAIEQQKPSIEKYAYQKFMSAYKKGDYGSQRLGQAFYNHFNLHKLSNQDQLRNLYNKDGEVAKACISEVFKIH